MYKTADSINHFAYFCITNSKTVKKNAYIHTF